jgi:hypothetical protein
MSQPGPPPETLRVSLNHGLFITVRATDDSAVAASLASALEDLGLAPGDPWTEPDAAFRQGTSRLAEVALHAASGGWVTVVPAWNDEELMGLVAQRLSAGGEALAVAWHGHTGYHSLARFLDGALARHIAVYSGQLIRSVGAPLPTETYDLDDLRDRLLDCPDALAAWLLSVGVDPEADRVKPPGDAESVLIVPVGGDVERTALVQRYLAEVDPGHEGLREELAALGA